MVSLSVSEIVLFNLESRIYAPYSFAKCSFFNKKIIYIIVLFRINTIIYHWFEHYINEATFSDMSFFKKKIQTIDVETEKQFIM